MRGGPAGRGRRHSWPRREAVPEWQGCVRRVTVAYELSRLGYGYESRHTFALPPAPYRPYRHCHFARSSRRCSSENRTGSPNRWGRSSTGSPSRWRRSSTGSPHTTDTPPTRANLNDSLKPLPNAAETAVRSDGTKRRLCNQALFKAIDIGDDSDARVGYRIP